MFEKFFESRAVSYQSVWASGDNIEFGQLSGTNITSESAFQVNAIYSAISLIADTISTLPLDVFVRRDGARYPFRPAPAWVQNPDVDLPREAFYSSVVVSLLLEGNAFIRVFSNERGEVVNLVVLNPTTVEVKRNALGRLTFTVKGEKKALSSEEIVFIPDLLRPGQVRGVSRLEALKENWGLALAMEKFSATFFGQGTNLAGVIEFPGNLTQEQSDQLRNGFDKAHQGWQRGHKTGVLSGGATWKSTQIDPDKSTLVESRNMAVADVARAFGVPVHLLGLPGTNSYASVEESNRAWLSTSITPLVSKVESAMSPLMMRTPSGENAFLKFNLDGLLRANIQARASSYSTGLQAGYLTINDVRRLEDLRPIEDPSADTVRVPLANVNIDAATLTAEDKKVLMAQRLITSGFKPEQVLASLGLPAIEHTGVPSVMLQGVAQIEPEDPTSVYEVE
jgi:HK97 family phage portal protein